MLWVFPSAYLPRLLFKRIRDRDPYPSWRHITIVGWTGMRGVVSLAAALGIPLTLDGLPGGQPFPYRPLILFLTFVVILATLVVQGLSLPLLIRWLGVKDDGAMKEEREARLKANRAALARLNTIGESDPTKADALQRLRVEYEDHIRQVEGAQPAGRHAASTVFVGVRATLARSVTSRTWNYPYASKRQRDKRCSPCAGFRWTLTWLRPGYSTINNAGAVRHNASRPQDAWQPCWFTTSL